MELLEALKRETETLAPHYVRHIEVAEHVLPSLERSLEEKGLRELVHLEQAASRPREEMRTIQRAASDTQEALRFLGCYYGLQLLHLNLGELSVLSKALASGAPRATCYRRFMLEVGARFRRLSASYMSRVLSVFLTRRPRPPFVLASVGTRSDQDDIDIALVDASEEHRENLSAAVARLVQEMIRYATPLHCHLAERLGTGDYSATVEQYMAMLDKAPHDFVTISELLGASRVLGDTALLTQFAERVTERYFFRTGHDNRYHEAYLRGILGEVRSLLARAPAEELLAPKDDALRLIKGTLWAFKTMRRIRRNNAWHILDALRKDLPAHAAEWRELDQCLSFLEAFRFVYHLRVAEEEEIRLSEEATRRNLPRVAEVLEFGDSAMVSSTQWVLVHYYDNVAAARTLAQRLVPRIRAHLTRRSVFRPLLARAKKGQVRRLATDLVEQFHFFRGTTYFEGVLDALRDPALSEAFIRSLEELPADERRDVARRYGEWGAYDPVSFLNLLEAAQAAPSAVEVLNGSFLDALARVPDAPERLSSLPRLAPVTLAGYLGRIGEGAMAQWVSLIGKARPDQPGRRCLKEMLRFHTECSRHCRHLFTGLAQRYPQLIAALDHPERVKALSDGVLKERELAETLDGQRRRLLDYFGLEQLRAGLLLLGRDRSRRVFEQATQAMDTVLSSFLEIARESYDRARGGTLPTGGALGLYVAGGHAREQIFNDECDLIAVLDSGDPDLIEYANGVIAYLNAELTRCGLIPHHYFAATVGRFVARLDELEQLLSAPGPGTFVQRCQILGSRLVAGERRLGRRIIERVHEPCIFRESTGFLRELDDELEDRVRRTEHPLDLKQSPGGVRDIELVALMAKAHFRLTVSLGSDLFRLLGRIDPAGRDLYLEVGEHFDYLRLLRELYRLTAGRSDHLWPEALGPAAQLLGTDPQQLLSSVRSRLKESRASVVNAKQHLLLRAGPSV
jgi:hypothetical protein